MNAEQFLKDFQDYLAPKLDVYEQAIYLYCYRHSRLVASEDVVIGFKSARKRMAFGIGEKGKPPSETTCYEKLRSLQKKGFVKVLGTERSGTKLRVVLPDEIEGLITKQNPQQVTDIEELDFFNNEQLRKTILQRDNHQCFYCLRAVDSKNYVIEHVISRPNGSNTYRNLVTACRQCNNKKGSTSAEDFIRFLYRQGLLGENEITDRLDALTKLRRGDLKPDISDLTLAQ